MLNNQLDIWADAEPGSHPGGTEESQEIPAPLAFVAAGSLILTGLIFWIFCPFPSPRALSWLGLVARTTAYILAVLFIHAIVLRMIYHLLGDQLDIPYQMVMSGTWISASWLPLLIVLEHQHSPLVTLVPLVIAAQLTAFLIGTTRQQEVGSFSEQTEERVLFCVTDRVRSSDPVLPALITSIMSQFGIGFLSLSRDLLAGLCFAGCIIYPACKLSRKTGSRSESHNAASSLSRFLKRIVLPIALTGISLFPFLNHGMFAGSFIRLLQLGKGQPRQSSSTSTHIRRGDFYTGIILLSPAKLVKQLMTPPAAAKSTFGHTLTKPLEIKFDGVYWYFEPPDERPPSDAPIVHGSPTKNTIHSTHAAPVAMVASQPLDQPIPLACCRVLRLEIINQEANLGPINLEIILKDTTLRKGIRIQSLGSVLIPLSAEHHDWIARRPVDETLTFLFPRMTRLREFNEITVAVKPFNDRAVYGAHIGIQKFTLVP